MVKRILGKNETAGPIPAPGSLSSFCSTSFKNTCYSLILRLRFVMLFHTMEIKYIGHSSFFIKSKEARVVTDPYDPGMVGLKFPKTEADIVTISHQHPDHNYIAGISGTPLVIDWPGEFEKNGVRIFGYRSFHDKNKGQERGENTLYKIETEDLSILHCGDLGHLIDDSFIEEIGEVDILMVPVGGLFTIDATEAVELVKRVEPKLVIPMHYNSPKLKQEQFEKLTGVEDFLKKIGASGEEPPTQKLTVKSDDLKEVEMKVVVMDISS